MSPEGEGRRKEKTAEKDEVPWYYGVAKQVRAELRSRLEGRENRSIRFDNYDDFLDGSEKEAHDAWVKTVLELHNQGVIRFQQDKHTGKSKFLDDKKALEKVLKERDYLKLYEASLDSEPDLWKMMILSLSEKNQITFNIALNRLSITGDKDAARLGINKNVLGVYLRINKDIQDSVDKLHVKEIEESQKRPQDNKLTMMYSRDGALHTYIKKRDVGEGYEISSYIQAEPYKKHSGELAKKLHLLSVLVNKGVASGSLPESCNGLGDYLQKLSDAHSSPETNFRALDIMWEGLEKMNNKLAQAGCPILIFPGTFAGNGSRDTDLVVGINVTQDSKWKELQSHMSNVASKVGKFFGLSGRVKPFLNTLIKFANGSSWQWIAGGYSTDGAVIIVDNIVESVMKRLSRSPFRKLFKDLEGLDELTKGRATGLIGHETGHLPIMIFRYIRRLGEGLNPSRLEEARADFKGALQVLELIKNNEIPINKKAYIQSYLFENIEFLLSGYDSKQDTSSTWYSFSASTMITALFKAGAIRWIGSQIEAVDDLAQQGIEAMGAIGAEILGIYANKLKGEDDVNKFVETHLENAKQSKDFQDYIDAIRTIDEGKTYKRNKAENAAPSKVGVYLATPAT